LDLLLKIISLTGRTFETKKNLIAQVKTS